MLTLHKPQLEELWFRQMMMADEETMSYNRAWGGTIPWPKAKWGDWYDRWVANPKDGRLYRYVKNSSGDFVGEIAYHYDGDIPGFTANVIIFSKYRGRGYGGQALELLCAEARSNGITVLYDDIAIDNPAAALFLRHGFKEEARTAEKIILKKAL